MFFIFHSLSAVSTHSFVITPSSKLIPNKVEIHSSDQIEFLLRYNFASYCRFEWALSWFSLPRRPWLESCEHQGPDSSWALLSRIPCVAMVSVERCHSLSGSHFFAPYLYLHSWDKLSFYLQTNKKIYLKKKRKENNNKGSQTIRVIAAEEQRCKWMHPKLRT